MRLKSTYLQTKCYFSDSIKNGNQRYCVQERCLGQLDKKYILYLYISKEMRWFKILLHKRYTYAHQVLSKEIKPCP